jgi:hypothetical protein
MQRELASAPDLVTSEDYRHWTLTAKSSSNSYQKRTVTRLRGTLSEVGGSVANLSGYPEITRNSQGTALLRATLGADYTEQLVDFKDSSVVVVREFEGTKAGTPARLSHDLIASWLAAAGPNPNLGVFNASSYSGSLAWNPSCWVPVKRPSGGLVDLSSVPVRHLYDGFRGGGIAITPRHVLTTHHFTGHSDQTEFTFLGTDGTLVTRTVTGRCASGNPGIGKFDSHAIKLDGHLYTLNADLPASVAPMAIASHSSIPAWASWLWQPAMDNAAKPFLQALMSPCLVLDQLRRARITYGHFQSFLSADQYFSYWGHGPWDGLSAASWVRTGLDDWSKASGPTLFPGFESMLFVPQGGDSGSPVIYPRADGSCVLVGLLSTSNALAWPAQNSILNAMIASADANAGISTGYTVTVAPNPIA